jgi:hypothetical protein
MLYSSAPKRLRFLFNVGSVYHCLRSFFYLFWLHFAKPIHQSDQQIGFGHDDSACCYMICLRPALRSSRTSLGFNGLNRWSTKAGILSIEQGRQHALFTSRFAQIPLQE